MFQRTKIINRFKGVTKIKNVYLVTGLKPVTSIEDGLQEYVYWYVDYYKKNNNHGY